MRFLLGLPEDGLALLLQVRHLILIAHDGLLHLLLVQVDVLALALPVTLVAHDVLEVLVRIDILLSHDVGRILDDRLGDAYLAGYLHGETASRITYLQLEECLHLVAVIKHGPIHHPLVVIGKMLQVLVVRGDDPESTAAVELAQDGLGQCSSDARFRTSSKLVNEQEGRGRTAPHHVFHVHEVRTVGREVVIDALLVTDVDEDALEDTHARGFAQGYGQSALHHVLQQPDGLQTYRLATRIGSADDEDALLAVKGDVEGHHLASLCL